MITPKLKQLATALMLFAVCYGIYLLFGQIKKDYCEKCDAANIHIIDSHVMYSGFGGLFDWRYVMKAAEFYEPEKYKGSYLFLDSLFPVAYSLFFISLSFGFRNNKWYRWVIALVVLGGLLDYGENFSFLKYLGNPSQGQAQLVAFFTSLKSLMLPINGITGLCLLVKYLMAREEKLRVAA